MSDFQRIDLSGSGNSSSTSADDASPQRQFLAATDLSFIVGHASVVPVPVANMQSISLTNSVTVINLELLVIFVDLSIADVAALADNILDICHVTSELHQHFEKVSSMEKIKLA